MLTKSVFDPFVGGHFRISASPETSVDVVLVEATSLGLPRQTGIAGAREPFSLIFLGPMTVVLPQKTYRVEHEKMGAMEIFLVPIGPNANGMRFQAIFN